MRKKSQPGLKQPLTPLTIVALLVAVVLGLGANSCSEPAQYCKVYGTEKDYLECVRFCKAYTDGAERAACQIGQLQYLYGNPKISTAQRVLECDRNFKVTKVAASCRAGVLAEEFRTLAVRKGAGESADRETGNRK